MAAELSYTVRGCSGAVGHGSDSVTRPPSPRFGGPGPGGLFVVHVLPLGIVQQLRMAFLQIPRRAVDLAGM